MKRWLIAGGVVAVALVVGIAIAIASTGGGGGGGTSSSAAPPSSSGGATVSAKQIDGSGNVLVDSSGRALYANDQEKGMVLCDGACLSFWTPLTVNGAPKASSLAGGKLGVVKRPDGAKQVTFNGKLLYTFYEDQPGQVGGDGFDDAFGGKQFTWHVVHSNGSTSSAGNGGQDNGSGLGY